VGQFCTPIHTKVSGIENRGEAEKKLAEYIASKHDRIQRTDRDRTTKSVSVASVLEFYIDEGTTDLASEERALYAIKSLLPFWKDKTVADINRQTCAEFVRQSPNADSTDRRSLGVLRRALNFAHEEQVIASAPRVFLPKSAKPRPDYLTREEFGKILWQLYFGHRKRGPDGNLTLKGRTRKTRHAAKIALCQFYTGSRSKTIGKTTFKPRRDGPYLDLKEGVWYRAGIDERETAKQRKPHRIPKRLLSHLKRWEKNAEKTGQEFIVETARHPGKPILTIRKSLQRAADKLEIITDENGRNINQHTLKHTAITLAIQNGMTVEQAADYFSTSPQTITDVYWHHSPNYHDEQVGIMDNLRKRTS
jgi:site-specific recombinase XerD